jgi:hypothetical protein
MRRRSAAWSVERHKCFVYKRVRFVATTPRARKRKNLAHAWREAAERHIPGYVEEELRGYLECGLLCFGFARAVCMNCRTGFVVAFSCKGRGVCPSCNGRHMAQTAAYLADHVIPPVPVRQWVISVPKRLRGMLADRPRAVTALAIGNVGKQREATTGGDGNDGRATGGCCDANPNHKPRSHDTSRIAWAKLMARVGEKFPLECPACGGDIRLIAFKLFYQCETIPGLRTVGNLRLLRTSCPRSGADPEDPHASWRTARAATNRSRAGPSDRLVRARPGP